MMLIDISRTIHPEMEIYPGDCAPTITRLSRIEDGKPYTMSQITLGSHTGTHVDAPLHFLSTGTGIDKLPMDGLVGQARVMERPRAANDFGDVRKKGIVLLKGREAHLTAAEARLLIDNNVRTIGTEALSIASKGMEEEVHRLLLEAGVVIIEGLDLSEADDGDYLLVCLPLKIAGCDGAPARAVLISDR